MLWLVKKLCCCELMIFDRFRLLVVISISISVKFIEILYDIICVVVCIVLRNVYFEFDVQLVRIIVYMLIDEIVIVYSRFVFMFVSMVLVWNGIIVYMVNVGMMVMIGVIRYSQWLVVVGWMIFFSSSFSMLVIGCSRLLGLMWFGLRCMCIQLISLCFYRIRYVMYSRMMMEMMRMCMIVYIVGYVKLRSWVLFVLIVLNKFIYVFFIISLLDRLLSVVLVGVVVDM